MSMANDSKTDPPTAKTTRPGALSSVYIELDTPARLLLGAQCSLPFLGDEVREKLAPFLSYESMIVVAGSIAALAAANAVGAGVAVDVVLGIVTVAVLGSETIEAVKRLRNFYELAIAARYAKEFEEAGREFAAFVTIVGVNVFLVLLSRANMRKAPKPKALDSNLLSAAWDAYVERIVFKVPRDRGVLWSKIGALNAERIAEMKGLTTLEMLLRRAGFEQLYARQFGTFKQVKAAGLQKVTGRIWTSVSRRYVASLEGKVTAFVGERRLSTVLAKGEEPVLIDELWEIAEAIQTNPKISLVEMVDVFTHKTWLMQRSAVLKSVSRLH